MPVQIRTSIQELSQEDITALVHHRPLVCAVEEAHHEQSIRALGHLLCCNLPVCAVGDHVPLEPKKEQVKETLELTQQELVA